MGDRNAFGEIGVIIVEDEALIRGELVEAFPVFGLRALGAEDVQDALKILEDEAPRIQVVFTDVHLPGARDGLMLARHIAKTWPWISVLITSGYGQPDPSEMPYGSRFVLKPYKVGKVAEVIKDMVRPSPGP